MLYTYRIIAIESKTVVISITMIINTVKGYLFGGRTCVRGKHADEWFFNVDSNKVVKLKHHSIKPA